MTRSLAVASTMHRLIFQENSPPLGVYAYLREGLGVGVATTCRDNGNFPLSLALPRKGGGN